MKRLRKFLALSISDKALFVEAFWLLIRIRLMLWFLPFQSLKRVVGKMKRVDTPQQSLDSSAVNRIVRPVKLLSRFVPEATCLTRSLTTQVMLARRGQTSELKVGVIQNQPGQLKAHAWVQIQGKVIIDRQRDVAQYTVLPSFQMEEL